MNSESNHGETPPEPSLSGKIDQICDRFKAAWKGDQRPSLDDYLGDWNEPGRSTLLRELLLLELHYRGRSGETPTAQEYQTRFPGHSTILDSVFSETARSNQTQTMEHRHQDAAARGLHIRCPHCHNPVEIVTDTPLIDIVCSSCGSQFSLAGEKTETRAAATVTTVGHFELIERLGIGGFGTVWKARDTELDRAVAVKIPRKGQLEPAELEQFVREARTAAQLRHPNIVSVHEVGRDGNTVYIVSDIIRGISLSDWLTGQRPTVREAAELCIKIAGALHHAHEAGVIHRDLKPQNIMIDADGEPHLMDFGLARRETGEITMTVDGQVLGTPAYMSPEQAQGEAHQADRRSDIYSFGVVLFELLTGELPFRGNARMLIHQVINEEAPSPRRYDARIPRDVETICLKCLEKDPRKRYLTARELAEELQRFLRGQPIQARPITRLSRMWRWCKRQPMAAIVAGLLLVLAISAPLVALREAALRRQAEISKRKALSAAHREAVARRTAEQNLYVADMNMVQQAWESNDVDRMVSLLSRYRGKSGPDDLRGFEWYYWWRHAHRYDMQFRVGTSSRTMAFSRTGSELTCVGNDGLLRHFDVTNGSERSIPLCEQDADVSAAILTRDGRSVAFSTRNADVITLRDTRSGENRTVRIPDGGTVSCFAFTSDGKTLAAGRQDGRIDIWDVTTGECELTLEGHAARVKVMSFSPDARFLASASSKARTAKLWDLSIRDDKESDVSAVGIDVSIAFIHALCFSSDSTTLALGGYAYFEHNDNLVLWDTATGEVRAHLKGHTGAVNCVAYSEDGQMLASASDDQSVRVWDVASGTENALFRGHRGGASEVAFAPGGKRVAAAGRGKNAKIMIWNLHAADKSQALKGHRNELRSVAFSPDGKTLASSAWHDSDVRLWDVATGTPVKSFSAHMAGGDKQIASVAFNANGTIVASGASGGTVELWDIASGTAIHRINADSRMVSCVTFSPDGKILASVGGEPDVKLWNAVTGTMIAKMKGHTSSVYSVAFSPDGATLASGSSDNTIRFWDVAMGREMATLEGHSGAVRCVAFSPDGKRLISASSDGEVKIWDVAECEVIRTLSGHTHEIWSVAVSPDGRTIASASFDRTIRLWNMATGDTIAILTDRTRHVLCVTFSPDGKLLASGDGTATVRLWRTAGGEEERLPIQERASLVVNSLFKERLLTSDVKARIRHMPGISEDLRRQALTLAERRWNEPVVSIHGPSEESAGK